MIPRRRRPAKLGVRKPPQIRSASHLQWVRSCFLCLAAESDGENCRGKNEAHHVRLGGDGGTGLKPGDERAIPLCGYHHRALHDSGQQTFAVRYGVNFEQAIAHLRRSSPHLHKVMA